MMFVRLLRFSGTFPVRVFLSRRLIQIQESEIVLLKGRTMKPKDMEIWYVLLTEPLVSERVPKWKVCSL